MNKIVAETRYFAVLATDKPGMGNLRARVRPEHRAWLRSPGDHKVLVRLGGPTLDPHGCMNGTLLVVQAISEQAVQDFVDEDPYSLNGLFDRVEIKRWQWSLGQPVSHPTEVS